MDFIDIAPGERNEIMIDLSNGSNATLIADLLPADPEDSSRWTANTTHASIVELRVDPMMQASGTLLSTLNDIAFIDLVDATQIRTFSLNMEVRGGTEDNMDMFGVNGQFPGIGYERSGVGQIEPNAKQ